MKNKNFMITPKNLTAEAPGTTYYLFRGESWLMAAAPSIREDRDGAFSHISQILSSDMRSRQHAHYGVPS